MDAGPLRVVRIIARLNVGGPARHVALLQRHLPARGYVCTLITGVPGPGEVEMSPAEAAGGEIERIVIPELGRALRVGDDVRAFRRIARLIADLRPDIVHTHTAKAGALGRVAAAAYNARRARGTRAAIVHTFHGHVFRGYFGPTMDRVVRTAERALAGLSDRVIAISPAQRHDLVDVFRVAPADKVVVVPLGLDLDALRVTRAVDDRLRRAAGLPDDAVVCGYVGRLVPIKHVDLLIRAFAGLAAANGRARLLIVGDGTCRADLERLSADLGVQARVHFAGWQHNLSEVYGAMDVVALTSRNEGTPVALIEASAVGKAIVATDVGGVGDVLRHDVTGLLVPDDDLASLTSALSRLMSDAELRVRLGAAAREDATSRFGYARLVDDIDALYRGVVRVRRGTGPATPMS